MASDAEGTMREPIGRLRQAVDQKWNDEVSVARDDLAALLADHARLSDEGLAEMVRQMSLHSLGCSGSVGTDGVECEWPDEGPCLVAALRAERDALRAALERIASHSRRFCDFCGWEDHLHRAGCPTRIARDALERYPKEASDG